VPSTFSKLAEPFDKARPSFMKHIGVLEASGLIVSQKIGRIRTCKLDRENRYENLDNLLTTLSGENNET
jgi:DNA-binding transcriptional ArsR family regulator